MPRVVFDEAGNSAEKVVACGCRPPQESLHWQSLCHQPKDRLIPDRASFVQTLKDHLELFSVPEEDEKKSLGSATGSSNSRMSSLILAIWSCVLGYCEALSTNKDKDKRYNIYPIPWDALERLVYDEFVPLVVAAIAGANIDGDKADDKEGDSAIHGTGAEKAQIRHRRRVQAISNAVWQRALPKPNVRDEVHANSVYVCLRGKAVDKKSLDCFGAAVATIAGLYCMKSEEVNVSCTIVDGNEYRYYVESNLTLSEDHAYETHVVIPASEPSPGNEFNENLSSSTTILKGTCEVAIPGTTKLAKSKRGREISFTLHDGEQSSNSNNSKDKRKRVIAPETSWLYMAANPVVCSTIPMALAAVVGNVNPTITDLQSSSSGRRTSFASAQLYDLKRDLLWTLYDGGHMNRFPFGKMELGDCEEHRGSSRGEELAQIPGITDKHETSSHSLSSQSNISTFSITRNEKLFVEAMHINRIYYNESQVYPYFYAGHFHKDAGMNLDHTNEYRLVEAMYLYARAAYAASQYPYHSGCMQLNKHMTTLAMLVLQDMLTVKQRDESNSKYIARTWHYQTNAIAFGTWLAGFFDSLFYWEEISGDTSHFVEILNPSHKYSIGKLFSFLPVEIRLQALEKIARPQNDASMSLSSTSELILCKDQESLSYFSPTRSNRLAVGGLIWTSLKKSKISIPEIAFVISTEQNMDDGVGRRSSRQSKRARH